MSCLLFETDGLDVHLQTQPNVREPREIRGRLRHCNGLQTPTATGPPDREGGSEVQAPSQDTGLFVLVLVARLGVRALACPNRQPNFSVKEKDEASLWRGAAEDSSNAFILRFAGVEGIFFEAKLPSSQLGLLTSKLPSAPALVSQWLTCSH